MRERRADHDDLIRAHEQRLRGFMRCRTRHDAVAEDLAQDTWVEVLRRIDTFDAEKGSFWSFVLIWGRLVLKHHYSNQPREMEAHGGELPADPRALDPADALIQARLVTQMLRQALACHRPPHEILTFGFSKLRWMPREIAADLSDQRLDALADRLGMEYAVFVPAAVIDTFLAPLRERLSGSLRDAIRDPRTRRTYESLLDRRIGETMLREYFPADRPAEQAIVAWWDFVRRATLLDIERSAQGELSEWLRTQSP